MGFDVSVLETANEALHAGVGVCGGERVRRAGGHGRCFPNQAPLSPAGPHRGASGGAARRAAGGARVLREGDEHDGDAVRAVRHCREGELAGLQVCGGRCGGACDGVGQAMVGNGADGQAEENKECEDMRRISVSRRFRRQSPSPVAVSLGSGSFSRASSLVFLLEA